MRFLLIIFTSLISFDVCVSQIVVNDSASSTPNYLISDDFISGYGNSGYISKYEESSIISNSIIFESSNKIGILNTSPSESLDLYGNFVLSGSIMPGGNSGVSGQILSSQGYGLPPIWVDVYGSIYTSSDTLFTNLTTVLDNSWTNKWADGSTAMQFVDGDGSVKIYGNTTGSKGRAIVEQGYVSIGNDSSEFIVGKYNAKDTVVFIDNRTTPKGIEYAADYSSTYSDRTLVDKGYVDNGTWIDSTLASTSTDTIVTNYGGTYQRQGNTVFFTYRFEVGWSNYGGISAFRLEPPIASNFDSYYGDCQGNVSIRPLGSLTLGSTIKGVRDVFAENTLDKIEISTEPYHSTTQTYPDNRYLITVTGSYVIK